MTDVAQRLDDLRAAGLHRRLRLVESPQGPRVTLDGAEVLLLCSNNYLGLADHPRVRQAAADAAERFGAGSGASRLISGNMSIHERLERRLADFAGYESALLFGSGYLANLGTVAALAILEGQPGMVERLRRNAATMREALAEHGLDPGPSRTQIVPVVVGDAGRAMALCERALEARVFAQAIRPPTVPEGTSRLRLSVMANHRPNDLRAAAGIIARAAAELGIGTTARTTPRPVAAELREAA